MSYFDFLQVIVITSFLASHSKSACYTKSEIESETIYRMEIKHSHDTILTDLHLLDKFQLKTMSVCISPLLLRSIVLRRAWHHDHQIRRGVPVFYGGFWPHGGLPLLLDHHHGAEAVLLRHHHTEPGRVRLHSFLPRLFSSCCGHQVSRSGSDL